jgi:hypothetical protein
VGEDKAYSTLAARPTHAARRSIVGAGDDKTYDIVATRLATPGGGIVYGTVSKPQGRDTAHAIPYVALPLLVGPGNMPPAVHINTGYPGPPCPPVPRSQDTPYYSLEVFGYTPGGAQAHDPHAQQTPDSLSR